MREAWPGRRAAALALLAALGAGAGLAQHALTVQITPDAGTEFAVECRKQGENVIQHAGNEPQVFGFDVGPVECRVRIVGEGGVDVEANGPDQRSHLIARGRNSVVSLTLQ